MEGRSRIAEQKEVMEEIIDISEREGVNLVLIAGDVYDTYNPSTEAEELFYSTLEKLAGNGKRAVVVIAGNHDHPDRIHAAHPIAVKHGIFLVGLPGETLTAHDNDSGPRILAAGPGWLELTVPGCTENAVICTLAYPSESRLNELLVQSLADEEKVHEAYSDRVAEALENASAHFKDDTVNLIVSHIYMMGGIECDSERQIQIGGVYSVAPKALPEKAHYAALGHLHRPQSVGNSPIPCRYSGSPLCYSFSEAGQQKEVVIVDVIPGKPAQINQVKLTKGYPLKQWSAESLAQAREWCEMPENHGCWVDLEIKSDNILSSLEINELRKNHPRLVNIRLMLPEMAQEESSMLTQMNTEEKFRAFVKRNDGVEPEEDLVQLFLDVLNEDVFNGDQEGGEES